MNLLNKIFFSKYYKFTFFSEKKNYQPYVIDLIEKVSQNYEVLYLSLDKNDRIDKKNVTNLYIGNFLVKLLVFKFIKTKFFLLTMTDLDNSFLKKSKKVDYYIFFFHAAASTHKQLTKGAFNNYDIVLANGIFQIQELRELERINHSKKKEIYPTGYMYFDYLSKIPKKNHEDYILFAPSWGYSKENCLDKYGYKIISKLLDLKNKVIFRPHPEHYKRSKITLEIIKNNFERNSNFIFDQNFNNVESIQKSKLVITDYSAIALEAFYPFLKPVLYINSANKIHNNIFEDMKLVAIEDEVRELFGTQIYPDDINHINDYIDKSVSTMFTNKEKVIDFYNRKFANINKVVEKAYQLIMKYDK